MDTGNSVMMVSKFSVFLYFPFFIFGLFAIYFVILSISGPMDQSQDIVLIHSNRQQLISI